MELKIKAKPFSNVAVGDVVKIKNTKYLVACPDEEYMLLNFSGLSYYRKYKTLDDLIENLRELRELNKELDVTVYSSNDYELILKEKEDKND